MPSFRLMRIGSLVSELSRSDRGSSHRHLQSTDFPTRKNPFCGEQLPASTGVTRDCNYALRITNYELFSAPALESPRDRLATGTGQNHSLYERTGI